MKLSILICTLPERSSYLLNLLDVLMPQIIPEKVEVLMDSTPRGVITTGRKRNDLLMRAKGDYIVFIDDDDLVPDYYVDEILKAIESEPDSIGFLGHVTNNGKFDRRFKVGQSWPEWSQDNEYYYRNTNHICPVKWSIASRVSFPNLTIGEDFEYSKRIQPLLKSEKFINKEMYFYHVQSK